MARTQSVVPPVDLVVWLGLFLTPRLEERWIEQEPDRQARPEQTEPVQLQVKWVSIYTLVACFSRRLLPTYLPSL